jgi:topoisomerase-4 subunit A
MNDDDVTKLLDLKIRRISAFDIRKNRGEINDIVAAIKQANAKLKNLTKTSIAWVRGILEKYGQQYPRHTEIETFHTVDKKAVAKANLRLSWDRDSGFFGSSVRRTSSLNVSDYDKILVVTDDGAYRVMSQPEKVFLPAPVLLAEVFDPEKGAHLNLVWLDAAKSPWGKRVKVERFITNKVYSLVKEGAAGIAFLSTDRKTPGIVQIDFVPQKRAKLKTLTVDLAKVPECGLAARGTRLATKPVEKVILAPEKQKSGKK